MLSRELLAHPQGRERLEREARVISQLTHPHICVLHDVGIAPVAGLETPFLVMELVEGETLNARLRRGALPIAQALDNRHRSPAGARRRARGGDRPPRPQARQHHADEGRREAARFRSRTGRAAPRRATLRSADDAEPLTKEGHLLGTMPYMAPEQLRGEEADARSDVFAFGAVLYEMVTGARAFDAASDAALVAAILERDPAPIATRQPLAPPALDRIVATCLAKDPDERWPRARDVLRELTWLRDDSRQEHATTRVGKRVTRRSRAWLVAAAIVGIALSAWALFEPAIRRRWAATDDTSGACPSRNVLDCRAQGNDLPARHRLKWRCPPMAAVWRSWRCRPTAPRVSGFAVSTSPNSELIAGTDGARFPFWSPDGRSLAFFAGSNLIRIDERGSSRQKLADVLVPQGGAWSHLGTIVFSSTQHLEACRRERRPGDVGLLPRPIAERANARLAGVSSGRSPFSLSHAVARSNAFGCLSGSARFERASIGDCRHHELRRHRHASVDIEQPIADGESPRSPER